jgi:hypothetical protein
MKPLLVSVSVAFWPIPKLPKFWYRQKDFGRSLAKITIFWLNILLIPIFETHFTTVLFLLLVFGWTNYFYKKCLFPCWVSHPPDFSKEANKTILATKRQKDQNNKPTIFYFLFV